jgi:hypothetical protein
VHRDRHREKSAHYNETSKRRRQQLKLAAFNAYGGPRCVCCGEDHLEFLSIDHVDQNGAEHRRKLMGEKGWSPTKNSMCGATFYLWLKQNSYPPGFRVLCMNCNFSLSRFGYCPHQLGVVITQY